MTRRTAQLSASTLFDDVPVAVETPAPETPTSKCPAAESRTEQALAVREVLGFRAEYLLQLPLPSALLLSHEGGRLVVATHKAALALTGIDRSLAFVGPELVALIAAAEADRASPATLADWCERKVADSSWRLTVFGALVGLPSRKHVSRGWTVAQVIAPFGLSLEEVFA